MNTKLFALGGILVAAFSCMESRAAEAVLRYPGPLERNLNTVCWTGTRYVAGGDFGVVLGSPDGAVWTLIDTPAPSHSPGSPSWRSSAAGGGKVVLGGDSAHFLSSNDGLTWTCGTVPPSPGVLAETFSLGAAAASGGTLTLAGRYDAAAYVSLDGITWTREPAPDFFRALATNGSGTVGWADSSPPPQGFLRKSGGVWESTTTTLNGKMRHLVWTGVRYVGVGDGGAVATSPDGTTWTPRTSGVTEHLTHVVWTGSHAVAVGAGGMVITSPNGADWTTHYGGTLQDLSAIAWSGTGLVAVGKAGAIVTSPNGSGTSWTVAKQPVALVNVKGIGWTGASALAVGSQRETLFSPDGITWTRTAAGPGPFDIECIAASEGRIVVGDGKDGLWSCPPNGSSWAFTADDAVIGALWDGTRFVALTRVSDRFLLNYSHGIRTSSDGLAWTPGPGVGSTSNDHHARMPTNDIAFTGERYIVRGGQSPDAATWQSANMPEFARLFRTSDGLIGVGLAGNIWTSPDGLTWTPSVLTYLSYFDGVVWTGSRLLAVTSSNTGTPKGVFEASPGRQWRKIHEDATPTSIAWTGSRAIIASDGLIYSLENLDSTLPVIWQTWLESYFTPEQMQDPAVSGATADPEGDGVPNVIEYATGNDPKVINPGSVVTALPPMPGQGTRFQWQQETGRTEVRVKAETSPDLSLWDDATISPVSGTDGGPRTMQVTVTPGIGRIYFRLRVELVQ